MKKICTIIVIGVLILLGILTFVLVDSSSNKLSEDYSKDEVIARAKEVVELINVLDYAAINNEIREDLQENLSVEKLENVLAQKIDNAAEFTEYTSITITGQKSKSTGEDYATAILMCKYENSNITYVISMDKNMDIVGIYLK